MINYYTVIAITNVARNIKSGVPCSSAPAAASVKVHAEWLIALHHFVLLTGSKTLRKCYDTPKKRAQVMTTD